jgi:predicted RecA/RadA family phage recombinase
MDTQEKPKKQLYKKWWAWVIGVIVVFFVINAVNGTPTKVTDSGATVTAAQTTFKVGDQVKEGDTYITVTKVNKNWQSSNQFDTPRNAGDVFVVATIAIENKGSSDLSVSGIFDFKLKDADGVIRDQTLGGIGLNSLSSISSLAPGGKASGDVIFEVPKTATSDMTLEYDPIGSFGSTVDIELQ